MQKDREERENCGERYERENELHEYAELQKGMEKDRRRREREREREREGERERGAEKESERGGSSFSGWSDSHSSVSVSDGHTGKSETDLWAPLSVHLSFHFIQLLCSRVRPVCAVS